MPTFTKERIDALEKTLSPARLKPYRDEANGNLDLALRLYMWNVELCEALYLPFQLFEVTLRNALDKKLVEAMGDQWWKTDNWSGEQKIIDRAKENLRITPESVGLQGAPWRRNLPSGECRDNMVAALSFSFWPSTMAKWRSKLWDKHLKFAFPGRGKQAPQSDLLATVERVKFLRNQIAHHEPIFDYNLVLVLDEMIQVVDWICPETATMMKETNRFMSVWNRKPR